VYYKKLDAATAAASQTPTPVPVTP
jgi:hypothetical protein